jgi:hypothetical protein
VEMFKFSVDKDKLKRMQKQLNPRVLEKAISYSLNEVQRSAIAKGTTETTKYYNIKASDIKRNIRQNKARIGESSIEMSIKSDPIPLYRFGASEVIVKRKGRKIYYGAKAKVLKKSRKKRYRGAFIATMKSGHTGIFRKAPTAEKPNRIKEQYVFSPTTMLKRKGLPVMERIFETKLLPTIESKYRYFLSKI